ncbi:MAG: shikimate dehydrogenase [Bacteroidetes bacterium]|nr:shikimate dehydrogenase [Bacteroidota bacterium]
MKSFGLIGYPLSHSFSKKYFDKKFQDLHLTDCAYHAFSLENITDFPRILKENPNLVGVSVTSPHKQHIIPFLDEIDEAAQQIGAVNCLKITKGKIKGYNTDAFGFSQSLRPFLDTNHQKALIFGYGGAAKAVAYALKKRAIDYAFVVRTLPVDHTEIVSFLTYEQLNEAIIGMCKLLIQATPLGMGAKAMEALPIPYHAISAQHLAYDLIYNPAETVFLQKAKQQGALICNGYNMLCFQADEAWRIWNEENIL